MAGHRNRGTLVDECTGRQNYLQCSPGGATEGLHMVIREDDAAFSQEVQIWGVRHGEVRRLEADVVVALRWQQFAAVDAVRCAGRGMAPSGGTVTRGTVLSLPGHQRR